MVGEDDERDSDEGERMDEPATPPPAAAVEIESTLYITQKFAKLDVGLDNLREKVDDIPKNVGETTRVNIAELETRLTKSISESEARLTKAIGEGEARLTESINRLTQYTAKRETRLTKAIGDVATSIVASENKQIKWMIGVGLGVAGLVLAIIRLFLLPSAS